MKAKPVKPIELNREKWFRKAEPRTRKAVVEAFGNFAEENREGLLKVFENIRPVLLHHVASTASIVALQYHGIPPAKRAKREQEIIDNLAKNWARK